MSLHSLMVLRLSSELELRVRTGRIIPASQLVAGRFNLLFLSDNFSDPFSNVF